MPPDDNQEPKPEALDANAIAKIVNAAISTHMSRYEKQANETFTKMLDERMKAVQPPAPKDEPKDKGKQLSPEALALQNQFEELKKSYADSERKRAEIERQARDERAYAELRSHLSGVRPELQEVAARDLFHSQKRVVYDEPSGRYLFKVTKAPAPGLQPEEMLLPIGDGVADWMKSKEAAGFIPAPTGSGPATGTRGPVNTSSGRDAYGLPKWDKPASSENEKLQRAYEREQAIAARQKQ